MWSIVPFVLRRTTPVFVVRVVLPPSLWFGEPLNIHPEKNREAALMWKDGRAAGRAAGNQFALMMEMFCEFSAQTATPAINHRPRPRLPRTQGRPERLPRPIRNHLARSGVVPPAGAGAGSGAETETKTETEDDKLHERNTRGRGRGGGGAPSRPRSQGPTFHGSSGTKRWLISN